jgi:hypothetical protein
MTAPRAGDGAVNRALRHRPVLAWTASVYADVLMTSANRLPGPVKKKVLSFGEHSYGAHKVALVMTDGTVIEDVIVGWGDEVVRVAGVDASSFDTSQVIDAIDRGHPDPRDGRGRPPG